MKTNEFRTWMLQFGKILESAESRNAAINLAKILDLFAGHKTKTLAAFLKAAKVAEIPSDNSYPTISTLLPTLRNARKLLENCAKATFKNDLNLFLEFLQANESVNIEAFVKSVASALKQKPKTKPKTKRKTARHNLDQKQIDNFIDRLTKNFENEESFMSICDELKENANLTQLDAVAIARGIDSQTPARASKNVALKRVQKRFEELKKYRDKANSMQGRSAA